MISVLLLIAFVYIAYRLSPRERQEDAHVHGAGQIGLLAAVALFGVDYFTSYYYATGELMGALHPYGLQQYGYIAVAVIAVANIVFGLLYMYSLGIFNEGGGSYTASMRYLLPTLSLVVAVVLIQDYIFTIVVSSLSGVDQLLSVLQATGIDWIWHFIIGAILVSGTWYLTIRGRGESARMTFILLAIFVFLDRHDVRRIVRRGFARCGAHAEHGRSATGHHPSGDVPYADRFDEGSGRPFRDWRRCRTGSSLS